VNQQKAGFLESKSSGIPYKKEQKGVAQTLHFQQRQRAASVLSSVLSMGCQKNRSSPISSRFFGPPPPPPPPVSCLKNTPVGSKSEATVSRPAMYGSRSGATSSEECPGGISCSPDRAERSSRSTWWLKNTNRVGDQHGIKTKISHQANSPFIDTKVSVQVPIDMRYECM